MSLDVYENIFQEFPPVSSNTWKEKIIKDLKGEPFEKLIWHSKEGIDVLPFYTQEDNLNYQLVIPEKLTNGWQITEHINVENIDIANKNALSALENGATSIIFNLQKKLFSPAEINLLLKDILIDVAPVFFENFLTENKNDLENVVANSFPNIIKIPQLNTIVDELVAALQQAISVDENKIVYFHFSISENYFFEIAKLRALRWLWKQVCDIQERPYQLFVFSQTGLQKRNEGDENTNMLRNTTEAMSAILGGCDSLTINSHDIENENSDFGKRIARNINHILYYESYFNEIQDAAKGSYYIEYLTYQLCQKTWNIFAQK